MSLPGLVSCLGRYRNSGSALAVWQEAQSFAYGWLPRYLSGCRRCGWTWRDMALWRSLFVFVSHDDPTAATAQNLSAFLVNLRRILFAKFLLPVIGVLEDMMSSSLLFS